MTKAEFYTAQFYSWEFRGRGWILSDSPVQLEPPFLPFFRHGYAQTQIDDGKKHTVLSSMLEYFKEPKQPVLIDHPPFDYEIVEPYPYEEFPTLAGLQLKFPKDRKVTPEKMKALLVMLSYTYALFSFEIIGTEKEIIIQFVCDEVQTDILETYIGAYFPSCTVLRSDKYVSAILDDDAATMVVDFGLKHECVRPLNIGKNSSFDPLIIVLATLERLSTNQQAGFQILFQPVCNKWSESLLRSVSMHDGSSFFIDVPEAPQLAMEKIHSPLYAVTIRAFAQGDDLQTAASILHKLNHGIITASKGTYNELIPLVHQAYDVETRIADIYFRESHRLGMLLNIDELTTLLHIPSESILSKKLFATTRKTKGIPPIAKGKQCTLGINIHNGIETAVTVGIEERLKHTHIIGATGTGKSTLIANLILQDINNGIGVVVCDPHGDLIDDIIARIPTERLNDVVLVDPADSEFPVGLNILQANSDIEKEVLSSDLVAAFRKYATSWGDQMNAVFGNAILAMLESTKGGTLNDVRRFLLEKDFRTSFLKTVTDPSVIYYWEKEYPILKSNSIGPILTRLDTFLRPKSIRNMVVQKTGLDFEALFNTNKIVLLKLSQGLIGVKNSFLLGSLLLSKMHQAILRRQQYTTRTPIFIYIDEFHNFITPSIKEMLSGIRKYNVGLTLSHQDLHQLQREDGELLNAVLGNVTTRIVFRVGEPDAKKLQDGFSGFDHHDLQNLGRGEAVIRIEQPQYDCSLDTIALDAVSAEQREEQILQVRNHSRATYATPKEEVEQMLYESFNTKERAEEKKQEPKKEEPAPKKQAPPKEPQPEKKQEKTTEPSIPKQQTEKVIEEKDLSTHRYLQTLIKKMAEARGYVATIEMQVPDGSGSVDVLLSKDQTTIAVEICITTDAEWEVHNIEKCINAGYTVVISLSNDLKQLEKIKQKCISIIPNFSNNQVFFYTPDALFAYLDQEKQPHAPTETTMKGYRVNVSYEQLSQEEIDQKRKSMTKVVVDAMRKRKK